MRPLAIIRAPYRLLLCLSLMLTCVAAQAQKIKVEYDKSLDFSKFKTYAIDPVDNAAKPLLRLAIQGAIEDDLNRRGLQKVADNPDLYVQMYGAIDSDFSAQYNDAIYGGWIPPFGYNYAHWYVMPGTVTTVVVHKGELAVDLIDAKRKRLVWRGIAKQSLSEDKKKLVDQVNTAVEKMFQRYPVAKK